MFKELSPLLAKRSLILTLSSIGDDRVRVTITPRPIGKDEARELSQPFAVEGTAPELDNELSKAIVSYTAEHMTLERSLEQVKASMEAALKDAREEAGKKVAEARKGLKNGAVKTEPTKPEVKKTEVKKPEAASLFDAPEESSANGRVAGSIPDANQLEGANGDEPAEPDEPDDEQEDEQNQSGSPVLSPSTAQDSTAAAAAATQTNMFGISNEDYEVYQEAFHGIEDDDAAA
jgi:PRTRC genetic system protein E